jgi:hypothetical protein
MKKQGTNSVAINLQTNYTERVTAAVGEASAEYDDR